MKSIRLGFGLVLLVVGTSAWAGGSCAYQEGLMALERGHWQRAEVMLDMARREGNAEAARLLARLRGSQRLGCGPKGGSCQVKGSVWKRL